MFDLAKFVGTWRGQKGNPSVAHTFTCKLEGNHLRGHYIMELPGSSDSSGAFVSTATIPSRIEMQIGEPSLEDGVLLFNVNDSPFPAEFRLVGENEAVLGAASHKLPTDFQADHQRSIEGHRVHFTRQP